MPEIDIESLSQHISTNLPSDCLAIFIPKIQFSEIIKAKLKALSQQQNIVRTTLTTISVIFSIDPASINVQFDSNTGHITISLTIDLSFAQPEISDDPALYKSYRQRTLTIEGADFSLISDSDVPEGVRFEFVSASKIKVDKAVSKPDEKLIKKNYNGDEFQYLVDEAAICLNISDVVQTAIVTLMTFPNIKSALRTFTLGSHVTVDLTNQSLIIIYSTPIINQNICPYLPSKSKNNSLSYKFLNNCGEIDGNFAFNFGVIYPWNATFDIFAHSLIGASVLDSGSGQTTLDWWRYKLFARLSHLNFQTPSSGTAIDVQSEFTLEGDGEYGPYIKCGEQKLSGVRANIEPKSSMKIKGSCTPCMDDNYIYLRGNFEVDSDVKFDWDLLGFNLSIVNQQVSMALKGSFDSLVKSKLKEKLQIPLIKKNSWIENGIQGWKANFIPTHLIITFTTILG